MPAEVARVTVSGPDIIISQRTSKAARALQVRTVASFLRQSVEVLIGGDPTPGRILAAREQAESAVRLMESMERDMRAEVRS